MTAEFAARLEAAAEGSRELSDEVLVKCGWVHHRVGWLRSSDQAYGSISWGHIPDGQQPDPTRVWEDAYALISEEWTAIEMDSKANRTRFTITLSRLDPDENEVAVFGRSKALTLALCAAIVKAVPETS